MEEKILVIPINSKCTSRCIFCPFKDKHWKDELSYWELEKFKELYKKWGYTEVIITDGEPTNHPEFLKILEYVLWFSERTYIETNGERFSEKDFTESFLKKVGTKDVYVKIPIYGSIPLIHDKITGGDYKKALWWILLLKKGNFTQIKIHCLVLKQNYHDLENIQLLIKKLGLDIEFIYTIPDGHLEHKYTLVPFSKIREHSKVSIENIPICVYPFGINTYKEEKWTLHLGKEIIFSDDYLWIGNRLAKTYTEGCYSCNHKETCSGIFLEYLETFWEEEFSSDWSGHFFEVGKYKIETRNHGRPKCWEVQINSQTNDPWIPKAWSKEVNGELIWFYNLYGAIKESIYLGKEMPSINDWMVMLEHSHNSMDTIRKKLNMYPAWYLLPENEDIKKSWCDAFLWSRTKHCDEKYCFVSLRWNDTKPSRWWWEMDLWLPIRFLYKKDK